MNFVTLRNHSAELNGMRGRIYGLRALISNHLLRDGNDPDADECGIPELALDIAEQLDRCATDFEALSGDMRPRPEKD
jgi:hypothetical protein